VNATLIGILAYILLQLLIGFIVSKRIRSEDDYLLAGRRLGYRLATFSIFATWFGAESCIGVAGAAYANGLAGVKADPFGYALCLLLLGLVFAVPLWSMKITTIADFFRLRFSATAERVAAILMIPTSLLWAAAQVRAFGQVLSASSELNVTVTISIAAAVVIVYTVSGGLLADAITDIVQSGVLIAGLAVIFITAFNDQGGFVPTIVSLTQEQLALSSPTDSSFFLSLEEWAIPICGSVLAQEVVSRVIASRDATVARRSSLGAAALYLAVGTIPLAIGLLGMRLLPHLGEAEQVLPLVAHMHLTDFTYILFAGALVSAILSTVDSALLAASSLLSHNVIIPLRKSVTESEKVRYARVGVVMFGVVAYVLALYAEGVYQLVKDASSFGSAGIFLAIVIGMFSRFGNARSAIAAMITGAVVWLTLHYGTTFEYGYLTALAASLMMYTVMVFAPSRAVR
jgi:Na+/proline symporter